MAKVIDRDLGWKALQDRLKDLRGEDSYVRVGVFDAGPARTAEDAKQGPTNAEIGVWMEFGSEGQYPARPWLSSAFEANREKWTALQRKLAGEIVDGKRTVAEGLELLGLKASADVRRGITAGEGIPPPNAPSTIAAKGSSRPLVDTSQFVHSISHAVVDGSPAEGGGEE